MMPGQKKLDLKFVVMLNNALREELWKVFKTGALDKLIDVLRKNANNIGGHDSSYRIQIMSRVLRFHRGYNPTPMWVDLLGEIGISRSGRSTAEIYISNAINCAARPCSVCQGSGYYFPIKKRHWKMRHDINRIDAMIKNATDEFINRGTLQNLFLTVRQFGKFLKSADYQYQIEFRTEVLARDKLQQQLGVEQLNILNRIGTPLVMPRGFEPVVVGLTDEPIMSPTRPCRICNGAGFLSPTRQR